MAKRKRSAGMPVSMELIQGAVQEGINAILNAHPKFRGAENYISGHISNEKLKRGIGRIESYIAHKGRDWNDEKKAEFIYKNLANYVASGGVFDEGAKEVILKKSLEEKVGSGSKHRDLKGEKYIDKVGVAFRDLYHMLKAGDHAKRMPEFAQAVATVYDLGFLDSALDVLGGYGLVSERRKRDLKRSIKERITEESYKAGDYYEKILTSEKVAAAAVAGVGLGVLAASGSGISGNVIGVSSAGGNVVVGFAGVLLLVAAWLLFKG